MSRVSYLNIFSVYFIQTVIFVMFVHQGNDSVLELFTVLSEEEVQRKLSKKLKKAKKKAAK